jgi:hypothetical protein
LRLVVDGPARPTFARGGTFAAVGTTGRPVPYTLTDAATADRADGGAGVADGWSPVATSGPTNLLVHGGDGVPADETVFDFYFSDDHEERQIVRADGSGLAATFEGGSITFGPGTQTSQADYAPPMLPVPADGGTRPPGTAAKGTSEARDGDQVTRVEDWTVTNAGTEEIDVAGQRTLTWVIKSERQNRRQCHRGGS